MIYSLIQLRNNIKVRGDRRVRMIEYKEYVLRLIKVVFGLKFMVDV